MVKQARNEHKAAIEWLNNHTDEDIGFFLIEIKLYRIGASAPALKFELVEQPNDWTKKINKNDGNISQIEQLRYDFWTYFYDYAFENKEFINNFRKRKYSYKQYYNLSSGIPGCILGISLTNNKKEIATELYISNNKDLFDYFYSFKDEIEKESGLNLIWERLNNKKASRIKTVGKFDIYNKDSWQNGINWSMENLLKFKNIFITFYEKLENENK